MRYPKASSSTRAPDNADLYIETPESLTALVTQLAHSPWLAIDTEFLREKTYRARLCLLQLSAPGIVACIDPLALADLRELNHLLCNSRITKVLHAAHQDLEILYQTFGELPSPVFDTQIAAALLGQGDQIGYGPLVAEVLGVNLEKGHARTDWSKRPLDMAQLTYAANDVRYLGELYSHQQAALQSLGRLEWLHEESCKLVDPNSYKTNPEEVWKRMKGIQNLQGVALSIAQALGAWRERQAIAKDRPRRWIIPDETLLEIARKAPASHAELQHIRSLPGKVAKQHGDAILKVTADAKKRPASEWPVLRERWVLDIEQEKLAERLMAKVREEADRLSISPPLLATRREIERLASGQTDLPLMKGWRVNVVGHILHQIIQEHASSSLQGELAPGSFAPQNTSTTN